MQSADDARRLIAELSAGRSEAAETLLPLLYDELRELAAGYLRHERVSHTLQTTALVHEAWLRFHGGAGSSAEDRSQFLRIAARAMRQVLVDHARRHRSVKRAGRWNRLALDEAHLPIHDPPADLLDLDEALDRLGRMDQRLGQVMELRYFAGLTIEEAGQVLGVTSRTVQRHERTARAWLAKELGDRSGPGEGERSWTPSDSTG